MLGEEEKIGEVFTVLSGELAVTMLRRSQSSISGNHDKVIQE